MDLLCGEAVWLLAKIPAFDRTSAWVAIGEIGMNMKQFPSATTRLPGREFVPETRRAEAGAAATREKENRWQRQKLCRSAWCATGCGLLSALPAAGDRSRQPCYAGHLLLPAQIVPTRVP
jgi:hypothetical protein